MPPLPDSVGRANPVSVWVSVIAAPVRPFFSVSKIVPASEAVVVCAERNAVSENLSGTRFEFSFDIRESGRAGQLSIHWPSAPAGGHHGLRRQSRAFCAVPPHRTRP